MNKKNKRIVIWLTGLSGAGKTTIANECHRKLTQLNYNSKILDGDILRNGINKGLGFTIEDRKENIRRAAEVAKLFADSNFITICSFISPTKEIRELAKQIINQQDYHEIFVKCSLETCEQRDVKGLYHKARTENTPNFTGISANYEIPSNPNLILNSELETIEESTEKLILYIQSILD
jgi:adenylylsulfate kinase